MRKFTRILPLLLVLALLLSAAAPAFAASGKATVTIKYVTGDSNKTIAKTRTLTGVPGKHFSVKVLDIKGYTFIGFTDDHPNDFTFPKDKMTVLVHYAKGVSATVKYTDMYGNAIYPSAVISGVTGSPYTVERPYIKGYTLTQIQDPNHGIFGSRNFTITVLYASNGPTPVPASTVRLTVQSIEQGTGRILKSIYDNNVTLPMTVNLSSYNHSVPGYTFYTTLVNGCPASTGSVRLQGDTTISYVYVSSPIPTPTPVEEDATLYVYSVDEDTGDYISTIFSGNVKKGTSYGLHAPSYSGYQYDYTEVNGGPDWSSSVTVNYDTTVVYYYNEIYLKPAPDPVPVPTPDPDPDPPYDF